MVNKVELYLDKWQDVTAYLQSNDIVRQYRCDDAFATGTLQLRYDRSTNIPPYTLLRFNGEEQWFAKSTCRRYLTKPNYFIHNVELLELTSILSCYILGSKNFSVTGTNRKDYEKLDIIVKLMKQKYGVTFILEDYKFLDKEQEFTFGPGTTMYDAMLEIVKSYDGVKLKVTSCNPGTNTYYISFKLSDSEYHLNEKNILDEYYSQDSETYGSILESELTNVIDRNNPIMVSNITLRADDFHMTADNSYLMLPTRCEEVVDFGISFGIRPSCIVLGNDYKRKAMELGYIPESDVEIGDGYNRTYKAWVDDLVIDGYSPLLDIAQYLVNKLETNLSTILASIWKPTFIPGGVDGSDYFYLVPVDTALATTTGSKLSLKSCILPKEKWDLLEDREKPKYVYYETGTNRINGMNNYYKDEFWSHIVGDTVYPFLYYQQSDYISSEDLNLKNDTHVQIRYSSDFSKESIGNSFFVEYYPIVDICISCAKSVSPHNEDFVKTLSRSYDKASNFIDFDRLMNSIQLTNDMMGLPEGTIEYKLANGEAVPKAFQHIVRDGIEWTIASVVLTSSLSKDVATINLVTDYNKVADAIGVKTQYNETKNPLNNIIDRPVIWEVDGTGKTICKESWVRLTIEGHTLYKRVAVLENEGTAYVCFEALDQYCFDKQAIHVNATGHSESYVDSYMCKEVSYCDEHNEALNASISLGTIRYLTLDESFKLPEYDGTGYGELIDLGSKEIYKDARERIQFTLILNNCKVSPNLIAVLFSPIVHATISKDSSGFFDYMNFSITNPNDAEVTATIRFYSSTGVPTDDPIECQIVANNTYSSGFETQHDIAQIEVIFYNPGFENVARVRCSVTRK